VLPSEFRKIMDDNKTIFEGVQAPPALVAQPLRPHGGGVGLDARALLRGDLSSF